jgi:tetratricopeptide (TPR) repeat protein
MKHIITLFILSLSILSYSQSTLETGNNAYQDEQYEIAIQNYLEAVSNNQKSSELFYNLGNSYFKTNEIGEAIWAYEQALKIDPSNKDIIYNLDFTNNLTADKLIIETKGIGSWLTKNVFQFSENFWFYISLLTALLTALALYLFFTPSSHLVNNLSLLASSLFGLLLIMSFTFAVMHKSRFTNTTKAVIINANTKILTSPMIDAPTSFELHEGAQLNLKSIQDDWYEVNLNKNTGWVNKSEVWIY